MDSDHDSCEDSDGEKVQPIGVSSPEDSPARKRKKQKSYRKKVETSWSHERILKLIQEVESRRSLWDVRCPEYKMRKDGVWQEVADAIPASFNDCKGKWCNLRTTFKFNIQKLRKKASGQDTYEAIPITWKYFKPLMFLESNKMQQSTQPMSSMQFESVNTDESIFSDLGFSDELSSLSPSLTGQKRNRRSCTPQSLPSTSIRRHNILKEMAVQALQSMSSRLSQPTDSSTAFGEYIAAEMRNLKPEQAEYVRSKMRRAFNDIMDEVSLIVPQQQQQEGSGVLFSSKQSNI